MRTLILGAFTPRVVEEMHAWIEATVQRLLDGLGGETCDFIKDFAAPLPFLVIMELLGVAPEDYARFRLWAAAYLTILEGRSPTSETYQAVVEMTARWQAIAADRRAHPRDDLVTLLVRATNAEDAITDDELIATCAMLFMAGHSTSTDFLGMSVLALLEQPDAYAALRDDPSLIPAAVEELLRFTSPFQFAGRVARETFTLVGERLEAGCSVMLVLAAANRDATRFAAPDVLNFQRPANRHLGFGRGIHFCAGAALARLEPTVALAALTTRFPHLALAGQRAWQDNFFSRGLVTLPLTLRS